LISVHDSSEEYHDKNLTYWDVFPAVSLNETAEQLDELVFSPTIKVPKKLAVVVVGQATQRGHQRPA
jgi:hypothetical protein